MNKKEYRKQQLMARMTKIMMHYAVEEANKQTTEEFFSGKLLLVGK